ncbi:hypothetical protein F3Y22_tig00010968pilonHSYRG00140 [Hibiscus syriacus]|uniref:Reverse transcriptase Ty1/copia-type domain-containing protein n=1 Tax=Hibiscus syriacus TaxID=106335 RepID=A0A6A3C4G0_HIBSY|nr:hypothetical protein F3Y22_tig00010968pilonHSYRG00140 [Hibiscus syriacus]
MNEEILALESNNTWSLVPLPSNKTPIGIKWVYRIKYNLNGEVERFKARLVAKGYTQREGVDYVETFSPVAKMVTVRKVLALASIHQWPLFQMDVYNAFLQGDLVEEVYMSLPEGFCSQGETRVCRLQNSLYGLKHVSRQWNLKLTEALLEVEYSQSKFDYSLFTKSQGSKIVIMFIYVDDLLITGNDSVLIEELKGILNRNFKMKDLGELRGARPAVTPLEQNKRLVSEDEMLKDKTTTEENTLGCSFEVVRYIKSSPGQGVLLSAESQSQLQAFCDSDWATFPMTRRSITVEHARVSSPFSRLAHGGFSLLLSSSAILAAFSDYCADLRVIRLICLEFRNNRLGVSFNNDSSKTQISIQLNYMICRYRLCRESRNNFPGMSSTSSHFLPFIVTNNYS